MIAPLLIVEPFFCPYQPLLCTHLLCEKRTRMTRTCLPVGKFNGFLWISKYGFDFLAPPLAGTVAKNPFKSI